MATLSATPYDMTGSYFFFSSEDEYQDGYNQNISRSTGKPFEEYEIDFQDGSDLEMMIFRAMAGRFGLPQHKIDDYFDLVDDYSDLGTDEMAAVHFLTEYLDKKLIEALEEYEDVYLRDLDKVSATEEYVDELGGPSGLPENLQESYFDYESFGRDFDINNRLDEHEGMSNQRIGEAVVDDYYGSVSEIPKRQRDMYFDYESYARDLDLNGDIVEFRFGGNTYTVFGANSV